MLLVPTRRQRRTDQKITARRLKADINLNLIETFSLLAARRRKKDLPLLSRVGHRRRTDPLTALAAVGLLLILEHRYHFPLLYVGLFGVVGLYHNTILFALKKALRRHRDVDNQNESLVRLCARKSEVQARSGGIAYGLKEPIGPHFRYFIGQLRTSAENGKSSPQITVNRPNESSSIVPTTQVTRMILRALRKLGNGRLRRKPWLARRKRGIPFAGFPFPSRYAICTTSARGASFDRGRRRLPRGRYRR